MKPTPNPASRPSSPYSAGAAPRPRSSNSVWRIILITLAIVMLLPGLVQTVRSEVAGWFHARGFEAELNEALDQAEANYRRALEWDATNPYAHQSLATLLIRAGRPKETLGAAEQRLAIARAHYESSPSRANRGALITALNQSAYFSGLADTNLETALQRINEAIGLFGQPADPALLDTRGYVLWRLERHAEALHEMNLAVDTNKHRYRADHRVVRQRGNYVIDERVATRQLRGVDETMATLYYHRALVNEALGKDDLAKRDLERVKNLGFDPADGLY